jgi:hypothetical protein
VGEVGFVVDDQEVCPIRAAWRRAVLKRLHSRQTAACCRSCRSCRSPPPAEPGRSATPRCQRTGPSGCSQRRASLRGLSPGSPLVPGQHPTQLIEDDPHLPERDRTCRTDPGAGRPRRSLIDDRPAVDDIDEAARHPHEAARFGQDFCQAIARWG